MAVIGWLDRLDSGASVVLEFDLGPTTLSGLSYLLHGQFLGIMSSVPNQGPLCLLSLPTHIYALSRQF